MKKASLVLALFTLLAACGNDEKKPAAPGQQTAVEAPQTPALVNETSKPESEQNLAALEQRHALVPSDPELALDLAYAYAEQKNSKALSLADSVLKSRFAEKEKAYYVKAEYFNQTGNAVEALKNYDAAIAANYRFLDAHMDRGRLLFRQKKYDEALQTFERGGRILPTEAQFYFWSAKVQEAKGDKQAAKANYERAYALDKTLNEAKQAAERLK